tara:strand:+ start:558 stop:686 length:129 start_codon:yes stop_codon:yes gene_type:complete
MGSIPQLLFLKIIKFNKTVKIQQKQIGTKPASVIRYEYEKHS